LEGGYVNSFVDEEMTTLKETLPQEYTEQFGTRYILEERDFKDFIQQSLERMVDKCIRAIERVEPLTTDDDRIAFFADMLSRLPDGNLLKSEGACLIRLLRQNQKAIQQAKSNLNKLKEKE